jgi:hypothetical protein
MWGRHLKLGRAAGGPPSLLLSSAVLGRCRPTTAGRALTRPAALEAER